MKQANNLHSGSHEVPGGKVMTDAGAYDRTNRLLMGGLFRGIARDVAAATPVGARVLEVGCGPGHLAVRLAGDHGLDVVGTDLDPMMIERARANAEGAVGARRPSFQVADVAHLPFDAASFDVVVSTLSLHHWEHPEAGLAEIARVLRPTGRALIWDFRPGRSLPFHPPMPDPAERMNGGPLRVASATPWRWPWRFSLLRRLELVP